MDHPKAVIEFLAILKKANWATVELSEFPNHLALDTLIDYCLPRDLIMLTSGGILSTEAGNAALAEHLLNGGSLPGSGAESGSKPSMADLTAAVWIGDDTPALNENHALVLRTMNQFDSAVLLSVKKIVGEMPPGERLSEETTRLAVVYLIEHDYAERPQGDKQGARLTRLGRKKAGTIAD